MPAQRPFDMVGLAAVSYIFLFLDLGEAYWDIYVVYI